MATLNITSGRLDITAQAGKTWMFTFTVRDEAGALVNLTGYTARMQARADWTSTPILSLATGAGITLGGALGTVAIAVTAATTSAIAVGDYAFEIELVAPDGTIPPFVLGALHVTHKVVS